MKFWSKMSCLFIDFLFWSFVCGYCKAVKEPGIQNQKEYFFHLKKRKPWQILLFIHWQSEWVAVSVSWGLTSWTERGWLNMKISSLLVIDLIVLGDLLRFPCEEWCPCEIRPFIFNANPSTWSITIYWTNDKQQMMTVYWGMLTLMNLIVMVLSVKKHTIAFLNH